LRLLNSFAASRIRSASNKVQALGKMLMGRLLLTLALAATACDGFKFMTNWKAPTLQGIRDQKIAAEKFGDKKLVVITGTSSGLGRKTAAALINTGQYHVVGAVRDLDKMELVAELDGFDPKHFTAMHCELANYTSVREFCHNLNEFKAAKPIDRLICNAAVYQPSLPYAKWSVDG
jgi:protochlorophyllide reductase